MVAKFMCVYIFILCRRFAVKSLDLRSIMGQTGVRNHRFLALEAWSTTACNLMSPKTSLTLQATRNYLSICIWRQICRYHWSSLVANIWDGKVTFRAPELSAGRNTENTSGACTLDRSALNFHCSKGTSWRQKHQLVTAHPDNPVWLRVVKILKMHLSTFEVLNID